ncbi:MAG: hypothetical protein RLZZ599_1504 [Bacteroidota bacterium]|jgi:hypothetical protein
MIQRSILILTFIMMGTAVAAQERLLWSELESISFEEVYDEPTATWVQVPQWTEEQRKLWSGSYVLVTGYAIVLDPVDQVYALSAFPFSSCFFCGAAGPESVMEILFESPQKLLTDDVVTVIGQIKLNTTPENLPFTLVNARLK